MTYLIIDNGSIKYNLYRTNHNYTHFFRLLRENFFFDLFLSLFTPMTLMNKIIHFGNEAKDTCWIYSRQLFILRSQGALHPS